MNPDPNEGRPGQVVLYDAECGLCIRAVSFLLAIDARGVLRFAPLQGAAGQAWLRAHGLPTAGFESLVLVRDWSRPLPGADGYLLRTDALVAALQACGGAGRVLAWIRFIPRPWRDAGYRLVARVRRGLFGAGNPGSLRKAEWRDRFIGDPA
jgi:predicted DCC family thiol-disulfide oxidoreductase YuxK